MPAGNTGSVDVVDSVDGRVSRVEGFATAELERNGAKRTVGLSSATIGDGVVYVGNRGDSSVCAVGAESLRVGPCVELKSMPDGLAYVAATKEVWATTPRAHSIAVIDAAAAGALTRKAEIPLDGQPEGFAVDDARGVFFTNLEDKDRTLRIDVRSRRVTTTWLPGCGDDGPKGLALDQALDFLFVACRDRVIETCNNLPEACASRRLWLRWGTVRAQSILRSRRLRPPEPFDIAPFRTLRP